MARSQLWKHQGGLAGRAHFLIHLKTSPHYGLFEVRILAGRFQTQEGSSTFVDRAEGELNSNRSSSRDSPRFFPSPAASDFETWNLNRSAVLFSRQMGCSCPASR